MNALAYWTATQAEPALSRGESEYKGALKTAAPMMFIRTVINEGSQYREITGTVVDIDNSAATAMAGRIGLGKLKHLVTRYVATYGTTDANSGDEVGRKRRFRRFIDETIVQGAHGVLVK